MEIIQWPTGASITDVYSPFATDGAGEFAFGPLPPAHYDVALRTIGFHPR